MGWPALASQRASSSLCLLSRLLAIDKGGDYFSEGLVSASSVSASTDTKLCFERNLTQLQH